MTNALRMTSESVSSVTDATWSRCDIPNSMAREHRYFVYIVSSKSRRIYTGVTNDIFRRVMQHKRGEIEGFTCHYKINRLVYYEEFQYVGNAIHREKVIKGWLRMKKIALIQRDNPTWDDLAEQWGKPWAPLTPSSAPPKAGPSLRSG
jgi:putative endonuclease